MMVTPYQLITINYQLFPYLLILKTNDMKKTFSFLLLATAACCYFPATAQTADEQAAWMAYMTPGTIHQMMAKSAGTWAGKATFWMQPDAPPATADVEAKQEMILGGRYLKSVNTGNMMGMPFEGIGIIAYDNARKVFINSWIDNMGTGIMTLEGAWDDKTKSITFTGKEVDPATGKERPVKEVVRFVDDNNQVIQMFQQLNGKEFKSMEIISTRK